MTRIAAPIALSLSLAAAALGGCATTAGVHHEYVKAEQTAPSVSGEAVIMLDRNQTITASPKSLTGGAWTLTEPVGEIMATTAETIFDAGFSGGSSVGAAPKPEAYAIGLKLQDFSYKYDQLSNLGFAVTPKVTVAVDADVLAPGGKPGLHKSYSRKDYSGGAYIMSADPPERINKALHLALAEIFRDLLRDIAALNSSAAGAGH